MTVTPRRWVMRAVGELLAPEPMELELPGAGQVLVEVAGCGVCHTDLGSLGGVDPLSGGLVRIDPATGMGTFIGATGFSPVSGLTKLP